MMTASRAGGAENAGPRHVVAALDIGGTKLLAGLVTPDGRLLAEAQVPTEAPRGPHDVVERMAALVDRLLADAGLERGALAALGCSVPGPLDRARGVVILSPNLDWHDVALRAELQAHVPVPTLIDDDANCAALGEGWKGAGRRYRHFAYVTVSTGIGAGLVLDGQLYYGARDGAGEIGHTIVALDGPPCNCGGRGCLESLASGTAIANRARAALQRGEETLLRALAGPDPDSLRSEEVFAAAAQGDGVAREILRSAGEYLGIGLANLAAIVDPEAIVLGGGVALSGDLVMESARATFHRRALSTVRKTPLRLASLGQRSGLWGAARLVLAAETA